MQTCCFDEQCTECEGIVTRAYRELRIMGMTDHDAFLSAVRVLELRHPGQDRTRYFMKIAEWLGRARMAGSGRAGS